MDRDDPEAQQLERDRDDGGLEVGLRHRRDVHRDQAGGRLLQDTFGVSVGRPPDEPTRGIGRVAGHAGRLETGLAHEQRVVVVRP